MWINWITLVQGTDYVWIQKLILHLESHANSACACRCCSIYPHRVFPWKNGPGSNSPRKNGPSIEFPPRINRPGPFPLEKAPKYRIPPYWPYAPPEKRARVRTPIYKISTEFTVRLLELNLYKSVFTKIKLNCYTPVFLTYLFEY